MITLKLTDKEAWFLHLLLDECLDGIFTKELFKTDDEEGNHTFDSAFVEHIEEVRTNLLNRTYLLPNLEDN